MPKSMAEAKAFAKYDIALFMRALLAPLRRKRIIMVTRRELQTKMLSSGCSLFLPYNMLATKSL